MEIEKPTRTIEESERLLRQEVPERFPEFAEAVFSCHRHNRGTLTSKGKQFIRASRSLFPLSLKDEDLSMLGKAIKYAGIFGVDVMLFADRIPDRYLSWEKGAVDKLKSEVASLAPTICKSVQKAIEKNQNLGTHQDAFACSYQDGEYLLLGKAVRYAGFFGVTMWIVGTNRETYKPEEQTRVLKDLGYKVSESFIEPSPPQT